MHPEQKFQQRWEYRRRDDDDVDSSSDDTKSDSSDEPDQKKHKVLSHLVLPQEDEESDTPRSQQSNQRNITPVIPLQIVEANNMQCGSEKIEVAVMNRSKGNTGKKRKRKVKHANEFDQLSDLKTFTNSLLKELKVARDTMFVRMKEQITKLTAANSASRPKRKAGKTDKAIRQNKSGSGRRERPTKSTKTFGSSKSFKAKEKRTNQDQAPMANRMEKSEKLSLPVKKPMNDSDQTFSSYLTLPSILSKPQIGSLRTEFSPSDHIDAGCDMNRTNILERENFLTDARSHHGYLPSILPDEQFGSFSQMSSKSMGFFDQQSNQTPSMNPGLQVPLQQWPNNCFSITSQIVLETPCQENSSIGLRMMNRGGIRCPGRSHALSESSVTNTISCNMKSNTDAGPLSYRSQDIKGEHIFPSN